MTNFTVDCRTLLAIGSLLWRALLWSFATSPCPWHHHAGPAHNFV
jgi:hypothetical protein